MKTKTRNLLLLSLALIICCSAFTPNNILKTIIGNGKVIKENRATSPFTSIMVKDGLDLYLTQSDTELISVEAEENLISLINTEIENKTLTISAKKNIKATKPMKVFVSFRDLKILEGSSGSDIYVKNTITLDELKVKMHGGSDLQLNIKTSSLLLEISGGSDATLYGYAENANMTASGGSDIKANGLEIVNCVLNISGGSDALINIKDKLDAKASGGSDIIYSGNPSHVNVDVSGGSDCIKKSNNKK